MTAGSSDESARRLRTIILADVALSAIAGLFTIAMYFLVADVAWLFWVGLFVVGTSGIIATSLRPLAAGDVYRAVLRLSAANWMVAIGSTFVATFQWPIQLQVALLPIGLAATFVSRERIGLFVVASIAAAALVASLGLLQDVTGLSEGVPEWLKSAVLLLTAPPFAALVILVLIQHHRRLQAALDAESAIRRQLELQAAELEASRRRVVAATDQARRRIERDLHDGAQSRLVAVNLQLAAASGQLAGDPDAASAILVDARREVRRAHAELRDLAHGIYPTVLTQHGLVAALSAAADHSPASVRLDLADVGRLPGEHEAAIYFCVLEALQNAAKHADAGRIDVRLERADEAIRFVVADDGRGFDTSRVDGSGLTNLADRCGAIGGIVEIDSDLGRGTTITGTVPLD